jgi:hypothetical protein
MRLTWTLCQQLEQNSSETYKISLYSLIQQAESWNLELCVKILFLQWQRAHAIHKNLVNMVNIDALYLQAIF